MFSGCMITGSWLLAVAACASLLGLSRGLEAQRTWVVDGLNRPGTDFTDFPPALAAASDGDHIRLRSSTTAFMFYTAANINKAVSITSDATSRVVILRPPGGVFFSVSGIPAGKSVRIANVLCTWQLVVDSCAGTVVLDAIADPIYAYSNIVIRNSLAVTIARSDFKGSGASGSEPALRTVNSNVSLTACNLEGGPARSSSILGAVAIDCTGGTLSLSDCNVRGGGYSGGFPWTMNWPALSSSGTTIMVTIKASLAAFMAGGGFPGVRAVETSGGVMIMDPNVTLWDSSLLPDTVSGTAQVFIRRIPGVTTGKATPGSVVTVDLMCEANAAYGALIALPTPPVSTPWGPFWLDPNTLSLLDVGIMGPLEKKIVQVPLPSSPALLTLPIAVQMIASTSFPVLSGPSVSVIR